MNRHRTALWLLFAGLTFSAFAAPAQIPETFTNLQVLPKEIEQRELIATMRSYSQALGVRCIHCHVGEDPRDLSTVDFASDARDAKATARAMMKMVGEINGRLLPDTGRAEPLQVSCVTCHRGVTRPQTLAALLADTVGREGVEAAIGRYRSLRDEHYGDGAYDFSVRSLSAAVDTLSSHQQHAEAALALARLNTEEHPDSAWAHGHLGQLLLSGGDREAAIASFERALELEPKNGFVQGLLERAKAQPKEEPAADDSESGSGEG